MKGKDILTVESLSQTEVALIMEKTKQLKKMQKDGCCPRLMEGKTLAMIFHKASTRTRVSFEAGFAQMGGHALFLDKDSTQMGRGEPIKDTARVLSRYTDGIMIRTFSQSIVEELARYADIPVINGLTDYAHPMQALADIFTAVEKFGNLKGRKLVYIGDGNNVANSLMFVCAKLAMDMTLCCPQGYQPAQKTIEAAQKAAKEMGATIQINPNPSAAVLGASVLYTDVWASMGQEGESEKRKQALRDYKIDAALLSKALKEAIVMHCLPAHRGEEISDEVMEGPQSAVFDQAENRLHVQKAAMALLMSERSF